MKLVLPFAALALTAAAPVAPPTPALWVVRDTDTTIYLFGTVHALPKDAAWLDEKTRRAFDSSSELVLEIASPDPATLMPVLGKLCLSPGQPPIANRVEAARRPQLDRTLAAAGLPRALLDRFDTWCAAVMIASAQVAAAGLEAGEGVEKRLLARGAGKKVIGLETPEEQLGIFDALSELEQRAFLAATLDETVDLRREFDAMLALWRKGDSEALGQKLNDELSESKSLAKALLTDRNAKWSVWLKRRMDAPGTVFVAVGAGHLAGRDSVQSMLVKQGLTVKRL